MRLWADVVDANGRKVGEGPLTSLTSAQVTRALDGAGSVRVEAPLADERAKRLLTNERRIRVYAEEGGVTRELGRGVIREVRVQAGAGGWTLSADGPDSLDELKRVSVLLAREYLNRTPDAIAQALAGLAGWTLTGDALSNILSVRYDGVSVLKALQLLAEQQGLHLRLGERPRVVEFGQFGTDSGLVLINPTMAEAALEGTHEVALIERLSIVQSTEAAANWLLPLGAGEGVAQLTLAKATRSGRYDIRSTTGPDGTTLYYLADDASIAEYGVIQKVGVYRNIAPVTNSDGDVVNAANALYDAAAAWLARGSKRQDTYRVSLRKTRASVRPGDRVRLLYRGVVERDGEPFTYLDVDDRFFVLKVSERVDLGGVVTELEISTVDRYQQDAAQLVIGALEAIEIRNVFVQPYPTRMGFYSHEAIDSTHPVKVPVSITDATLDLTRALVRMSTRPMRSTVTGAAAGGGATSSAGGDHRHRMFVENGTPPPSGSQRRFLVRIWNGISFNQGQVILNSNEGAGVDLYTYDASGDHTHTVPDHTHALQYGVFDDTQHPQGIRLFINGVDRTVELGGPWAPSNAAVEIELEISQYLINAVGGLRRTHTLEWRCTSGRGEIDTEVELLDVIQPIRV